jgi:hypothetical protein
MSIFVTKAVDVLKEATAADTAGEREKAIATYLKGIEFLLTALKCSYHESSLKMLTKYNIHTIGIN